MKMYDQLFEHSNLTSINLRNQQIDIYQMSNDSYYPNIAYIISSSGYSIVYISK